MVIISVPPISPREIFELLLSPFPLFVNFDAEDQDQDQKDDVENVPDLEY